MKRLLLAAAAALWIANAAAVAQQPAGYLQPRSELSVDQSTAAAPAAPESSAPVAASFVVGGCGSCCATPKVCVAEPVKQTKMVYAAKCEEFCLPQRSLMSILRGACGCDGHCGEVRTRNVLVKKKVPDCDGVKCVVKEAVCAPCTAAGRSATPTPVGAGRPTPMPR